MKLLSLLGYAASALATTCQVTGGTSDDGPAIKAALTSCNNGGTVVLDEIYTIATVLQTTDLVNVAIELTGKIVLSPGKHKWLK
jgi:galacturan 1,4-alpha-galacturonidase